MSKGNARQIGKLQAQVAELQGQMKALLMRHPSVEHFKPCGRCGSGEWSVSRNEPIKCSGCGEVIEF